MSRFYDSLTHFDETNLEEINSEYGESFTPLFQEKSEQRVEEKEERDLEAEVRKVFEDAYREGEKSGYEFGIKKAEVLIKRLNDYLVEIERFKKELIKRDERLCMELAIVFAEAIILKEIGRDKSIIPDMIRKGLEICEDKSNITIRIRKEDAGCIDSIGQHLNITPDDTLREPGFIIETDLGTIDGRISVQISELKKKFLHGD